MAQDQRNTTLDVFLAVGEEIEQHRVTAATVAYDERYMPGWLQLRDESGLTNAYVSMQHTALIRRAEADPTRTSRPAAPMPAPPRVTPPPRPPLATQADVARLANVGSKAGRV
jgi:hypothetical protein